ncbi:MAG: carboxypeptidase regulatory-like domain-containing protein [Bryobacteraceae bacterium]
MLGLAMAAMLYAQIRSGTITGSVRDATGAVVPRAEVVVTNQDTGISDKTVTNEAGLFTVPYLQAGSYTVTVTMAGFAPFRQSGVTLSTAQTVRVDVELRLGAVEQTVEVSAGALQIQTESSNVSSAVQSEAIAAIPNVSQNPIYYAMLQAGVQPRNATADTTGTTSFGIGIGGRRQWSAIGINGGRAFTSDIQLDGLPVMGGGYNEASVVPNTEGLQEVRVISNNFTAEYGRGQGVVSMSTKSGTNEFHGQASYTIRNEALNANTNSNNANGIRRPPFKVNELGGSLGGPIIRDKLFFFSSYHFLRFNRGSTSLLTVPTALEKVGNFSQTNIRDATGAAVPAQVFDPFNITQLGPDLYRRAPFPGAILPNPSPQGLLMYSYYPAPNRTPDDAFQTNNFSASIVQKTRRHSLNNRVDYRIGKHSIYGSGGIAYGKITTPRPFGKSPFNGAPGLTSDRNPYGQIGDTIVLTNTLVLDVRYGFTRINSKQLEGDKSGFTDYDAFGIPKNVQSIMVLPGSAPIVSMYSGGVGGGSNWTAISGGGYGTKYERQMSNSLTASITKTRGRWTHKAGVEMRNLLSNYSDPEQCSAGLPGRSTGGNFTFEYLTATGDVAAQNTTNAQKGVNGAGILTGAGMWYVRQSTNLLAALGQRYYALYTQNDWRATSKLTLNLGLRWDLQPGPTERFNRMSAYDFTKDNPFGVRGALAFVNTAGYGRNLWETQYKDFGPRFGAAYRVTNTFVMRGGFGVTYLPTNTGYYSGAQDYGVTPFNTGTSGQVYGANLNGLPMRFTEPAIIIGGVGANPAAPEVYGWSQTQFNRYLKNGRAMQWNFFLEKSLSRAWFASVGYSASKSDRLINGHIPFQGIQNVPASTLAAWREQYIASNGTLNPATQQVPNPFQPTSGALRNFAGPLGARTISRYATLLPYPLLWATDASRSATINDSNGFASYHSLQLRLAHAFSSGLQVDAQYNWSKSLDYTNTVIEDTQGFNTGGSLNNIAPTSVIDLLNPNNNRKYSFSDIPHRFVATAVYELPFGSGKRFDMENRAIRAVMSGWQIGTVLTLQSGMPLTVYGAADGAAIVRPNRLSGVAVEVPVELQRWYDGKTTVTLPNGRKITPTKNTFLKYYSGAFEGLTVKTPNGGTMPDVFWAGTSALSYGDMRGPGRANLDMSLRRRFAIREDMSIDLSADASNVLNHTQLSGNYSGNMGSTNVVTNASKGLLPGMGTSDTFGTIGVTTFDPRQIVLRLQFRF